MDKDKLLKLAIEIRQCKKCIQNKDILNYQQPGYFGGNEILFIGQNPGQPNGFEKYNNIIIDKNSSIDIVQEAYRNVIRICHFGEFINQIKDDVNWDDISIINVSKCPTKNNMYDDLLPKNCLNFFSEQIRLINPKVVVTIGIIAKNNFESLHLSTRTVHSYHYAYVMKKFNSEERLAYFNKIKMDIHNARKNC